MKRPLNPLSLSLFSVLLWPIVGSAQQARPPMVSIIITAPKDTVKVGAELEVEIVEKNITKGKLRMCRDVDPDLVPDIRVSIRGAKGALLPMTEFGRQHYSDVQVGNADCSSYGPGEGPSPESVDVSKIYVIKQPGKYTIQAYTNPYDPKDTIRSNTITVTMTQ